MDKIKAIIEERMSRWELMKQVPEGKLKAPAIPKGRRGVHRDSSGITISVSPFSKKHSNVFFDGGLLYCYPKTRNKDLDASEIESLKKCLELEIPIYVILPKSVPGNKSSAKTVKLGCVMYSDDKLKKVLIRYFDN